MNNAHTHNSSILEASPPILSDTLSPPRERYLPTNFHQLYITSNWKKNILNYASMAWQLIIIGYCVSILIFFYLTNITNESNAFGPEASEKVKARIEFIKPIRLEVIQHMDYGIILVNKFKKGSSLQLRSRKDTKLNEKDFDFALNIKKYGNKYGRKPAILRLWAEPKYPVAMNFSITDYDSAYLTNFTCSCGPFTEVRCDDSGLTLPNGITNEFEDIVVGADLVGRDDYEPKSYNHSITVNANYY